jgi:hypothetical protein
MAVWLKPGPVYQAGASRCISSCLETISSVKGCYVLPLAASLAWAGQEIAAANSSATASVHGHVN